MLNLLSLRDYYFPKKEKNKHYQRVVKSLNRKLIQISFYRYGEKKWLLYRPCHQTLFGRKENKWRLVMEEYFNPISKFQTVSEEEYKILEKQVVASSWNIDNILFSELKKRVESESTNP